MIMHDGGLEGWRPGGQGAAAAGGNMLDDDTEFYFIFPPRPELPLVTVKCRRKWGQLSFRFKTLVCSKQGLLNSCQENPDTELKQVS